ncbi:MAG: urease accessory protein UreD [Nocardioidaceae bacterium]|nr:MAG: urease accessory protein UreD [Nocardioidaceae bacterium]
MIWSPRELGGKAWTPQLKLVLARGDDGVTRIERRRSRYPYVVLRPFWFGDRPDGMATVILQSGSGGLYAGEQLGQHFVVGPDAAAQVTTQAATVVHSSEDMGTTQVRTMVDLGLGAHFEYIADPLILFPGASLQQVVDARLRPDSIFVLAEGTLRHDPGPGDRPLPTLRVVSPSEGRMERCWLETRPASLARASTGRSPAPQVGGPERGSCSLLLQAGSVSTTFGVRH